MPKVVINNDYGGFSLSEAAQDLFFEKTGATFVDYHNEHRDDPMLVEVVETLGKKANGLCANLKVVDVPDGVQFTIQEYDGMEWVAEVHRTWS